MVEEYFDRLDLQFDTLRFHGVMVSTLDFESGDPSANLVKPYHVRVPFCTTQQQ